MELMEMLRYRRPHTSKSERKFINRFIKPLGAKPDGFGNWWLKIGHSDILWSAHTDTVHSLGGKQKIVRDGRFVRLDQYETVSNCLGADNTVGCWMLCEMARYGIPGTYIWHRAEEWGCRGSTWIAKNLPEDLQGISIAIAFDRKRNTSIITHQSSARCCSDAFAKSLNEALGNKHILDPTGLWTDTNSYVHLIPECTNISAGYVDEHSKREHLDIEYAEELRDTMLSANLNGLVTERDPSIQEIFYDDFPIWERPRRYDAPGSRISLREDYRVSMVDLIETYPHEVADILEQFGVDRASLVEYLREYGALPFDNEELEDVY